MIWQANEISLIKIAATKTKLFRIKREARYYEQIYYNNQHRRI